MLMREPTPISDLSMRRARGSESASLVSSAVTTCGVVKWMGCVCRPALGKICFWGPQVKARTQGGFRRSRPTTPSPPLPTFDHCNSISLTHLNNTV